MWAERDWSATPARKFSLGLLDRDTSLDVETLLAIVAI